MRNINEIVFYGPLAIAKPKIGGGEAGNRKTISVLENNGYKVNILEKPYMLKVPILKMIVAPFQYFYKMVVFIIKNQTKFKNSGTFHLSAFYFHLLFFEYLFLLIAKLIGYRTIYEIRAGGMIFAYRNRSSIYRWLFKLALQKSDAILCQGLEYCEFLKNEFNMDSTYYPNYVQEKFIPDIVNFKDRKTDETIKIIYIGRIVPSKQVDLFVEIGKILKVSDVKFQISLVGDGDNTYINSLAHKARKYGIKDFILFCGKLDMSEIVTLLPSQHFFIFPTRELREGHSNALTEAMSFGVVPIASNFGFNKSVINNDDLIINTFSASAYANKMIEIFRNKECWMNYSTQVYQRVLSNYVESKISQSLLKTYQKLQKS